MKHIRKQHPVPKTAGKQKRQQDKAGTAECAARDDECRHKHSIMRLIKCNSPHGVVSPLSDPVRHGAILLHGLAQLALDDKCLVGTLKNGE